MSKLKLPWVRNQKRSSPELPTQPPLHFGGISNGEIYRPPSELGRKVERLILEKADEGAKRHNIDRREFLASSMGMATSLWAINVATGCAGEDSSGSGGTGQPYYPPGSVPPTSVANPAQPGVNPMNPGVSVGEGPGSMILPDGGMGLPGMVPPGTTPPAQTPSNPEDAGSGGMFNVPDDPTDLDLVCATMANPSNEFIFDIQSHHVNRADTAYSAELQTHLQYEQYCAPRGIGELECFSRNEYVRLMFLESDTTIAVLSGLPAYLEMSNPITNDEIAESRDIINMMGDGSQRLINHHMVLPNRQSLQGPLTEALIRQETDAMQATVERHAVGAWKLYPAWDPRNFANMGTNWGYRADDLAGRITIEEGLRVGVSTFCIHKGLPIFGFSDEYNNCADVWRVAREYPEANFVIYHSGIGQNDSWSEGPYREGNTNGMDSMITGLLNAPGGKPPNVFAELGTTWQVLSTSLGGQAAAHAMGKLLRFVGEDYIVWGTDSIWYGSPQSQIESFLQFQIPANLQSQYGYPALTMEGKRKILGLNAARIYGIDPAAQICKLAMSGAQQAKLLLDEELGPRRWAAQQPMLTSRKRYNELLLRDKPHSPG